MKVLILLPQNKSHRMYKGEGNSGKVRGNEGKHTTETNTG